MPIFKIWHLGSKEVSIEEGSLVEEACGKAGWKSEDCEVQVIPEEEIINNAQFNHPYDGLSIP